MTTLEILKAARAKIADPERWTQGGNAAVNQYGFRTLPESVDAFRWCMLGAITAVALPRGAAITALAAEDAVLNVTELGEDENLGEWNDRVRHAEVMEAYDRAIATLEGAT